jgi:arylsulfatase A-like enzyme
MPLLRRLLAVSCAMIALSAFTARAATPPPRPNIVLIMVDDMGFSDLGCYGGEIHTPNIDALAAGGVRFTQFHNMGRCCPTRAMLMTGLQPHQAGIGHMTREFEGKPTGPEIPDAYRGDLNDRCVTLAQMAKSAGYRTMMAGKWHMAGKDEHDWPLQRGFERYYGCISGATRYFYPTGFRVMYSGNEPDRDPKSTTDRPFYTTDAFTDHAIKFLGDAFAVDSAPALLYLAYTAPHWPLQAHEEDIAKYKGRYDVGWDVIRAARYKRQLELGLIDPKWPLSPRDERVPAWDKLDEAQRKDFSLRMAVYAAQIDRVDQNIGKLVRFLKEKGQFDNTLILFLSDNGACAEGGVFPKDDILDTEKRNLSEHISYGVGWANVSSTPYRLYKHFAHQGGTATPFIVHWPAHVQPRAEWYREPAQLIDVMPTLVELTGAIYPKSLNGHAVLPGEGVPLIPAFDGKPLTRKHPLFMEHESNAFIRDGDWKLVGRAVAPEKGVQPDKWELFNLKNDGTELNDLSAKEPEKTRSMAKQWAEWADRVGVYPKILTGAAR